MAFTIKKSGAGEDHDSQSDSKGIISSFSTILQEKSNRGGGVQGRLWTTGDDDESKRFST